MKLFGSLLSPVRAGLTMFCRNITLFQVPDVSPRLVIGNHSYQSVRSVVFGKKGKRKTVKAVAKRFKRTGNGALKYWRPGKNHYMLSKSGRASRELRKPRYANKTQLKILNKMLSC
jgi:large subunit ribosomal protein L35